MASQQEKNNTAFFEFDFTNWKMRHFIEFNEALQSADLRGMMEKMAETTRHWEFDGDPQNVESWLDMSFAQWAEVSKAFNASLTASFRQ